MATVQVLLSVYLPNEEYLIKQLDSLNQQKDVDCEILIYDDGAGIRPVDPSLFQTHLTDVDYRLIPGSKENLGYVKAFETLIDASDAEYLAFCDQDDIWKPEKLQRCIQQLQQDGSLAVATDKSIIDKDDHIVCESVKNTSTKYYDTWNSGDDICKYDLFVCFAVGMSMFVNGAFARGCMPISKYTAHDKWLLACAATEGSVSYIDQPLVLYRRHGNNVSGTLQDVHSKKDYYVHRILRRKGLLDDFFLKYPNHKDKEEVMDFMDAQLKGDRKRLKKYSYLAPDIVRFDLVVSVIPSFLFPLFLSFVRKIA